LRANFKSISHRCYLFEVAFVWELTKETIDLPLVCLQGGYVKSAANRQDLDPEINMALCFITLEPRVE